MELCLNFSIFWTQILKDHNRAKIIIERQSKLQISLKNSFLKKKAYDVADQTASVRPY